MQNKLPISSGLSKCPYHSSKYKTTVGSRKNPKPNGLFLESPPPTSLSVPTPPPNLHAISLPRRGRREGSQSFPVFHTQVALALSPGLCGEGWRRREGFTATTTITTTRKWQRGGEPQDGWKAYASRWIPLARPSGPRPRELSCIRADGAVGVGECPGAVSDLLHLPRHPPGRPQVLLHCRTTPLHCHHPPLALFCTLGRWSHARLP